MLGLPKEQQDELAALLEQTSLSAIINASKVVADRLRFVHGLENLIFDPESKRRVLERKQLHRMLAVNAWIFGEEYNLAIDDEGLEAVLAKHRELLGGNDGDDDPIITSELDGPVLMEDGRQGIVDLMLSKALPQPDPMKREHLVVELKRPRKKVDSKVMSQLEEYAFAVARDERFRDTETRWRFVAISNEMTDTVRRKASQRNREPGLYHDDDSLPLTIWVFTWAQLIQRAKVRLEFFRKELNYNVTRASSDAHLRQVYERYIPSVERNDSAPPNSADDESDHPSPDSEE